METSLNVRYPEPDEENTKHIEARVTISFSVECDVPDKYEELDIEQEIKERLYELNWQDETIEEVEVI